VAIGSSSDGVTGGGKIICQVDESFLMSFSVSICRPPVAIGSSSDGVTGGGKKVQSRFHLLLFAFRQQPGIATILKDILTFMVRLE